MKRQSEDQRALCDMGRQKLLLVVYKLHVKSQTLSIYVGVVIELDCLLGERWRKLNKEMATTAVQLVQSFAETRSTFGSPCESATLLVLLTIAR